MIKVAEIVLHEANEPYCVADLRDTDLLAGKHGAEVDLAPADADSAAASDAHGSVVVRVFRFRRRVVDARRRWVRSGHIVNIMFGMNGFRAG